MSTLPRLAFSVAVAAAVAAASSIPLAADASEAPSPQIAASVADSGHEVVVSGLGAPQGGRARTLVFLVDEAGRRHRQRVTETRDDGTATFVVAGDTGNYSVLAGRPGHLADAGTLRIPHPAIDSLATGLTTPRGTDVVITGRNFGARRGSVEIAGREVKIRNWSADAIRVRAERPATGPHDVIVRTATSDGAAPCGLLVCGGAALPTTTPEQPTGPDPLIAPHDVWRFHWTPGTPGQTSSHNNSKWNWNEFLYDPVLERFRFEANVDPGQFVDGIYLMINEGGSPATQPDVSAEVFFDLHHGAPRTTVFAYKSRSVGDRDNDGWPDAGQPGPDRILSSLVDDSFVLWTTDRTETDGTRTLGFELDCREINAHRPIYGRTDGSAWRGLRFGRTIGTWAYLQQNTNSTYVDGWMTRYEPGAWGTYPSIDGPDFFARSEPWQSWMTARPTTGTPTPVPGGEPTGEPVGDPVAPPPLLAEGEENVIRGTPFADGLNGTPGGDAIRAGVGGDVISSGGGNDLILADRTSGGARIDGGDGDADTLVLRSAPGTAAFGGGASPATVTLVLDPTASGAIPSIDAISPSEVRLGAGARGRIVLPGGGVISFRGVEVIRF